VWCAVVCTPIALIVDREEVKYYFHMEYELRMYTVAVFIK